MSLRRFALSLALVPSLALSLIAGKSDGRLDIWWCDSDGGGSTLIITPFPFSPSSKYLKLKRMGKEITKKLIDRHTL